MKKYLITAGVAEDRDGKALHKVQTLIALNFALKSLSYSYGGATRRDGKGVWINEAGRAVKEDSVTLEVLDVKDMGPFYAEQTATTLKRMLNQNTVLFETEDVEGKLI